MFSGTNADQQITMRVAWLSIVIVVLGSAQDATTRRQAVRDLNGNRAEGPVISERTSPGVMERVEKRQNLNGHLTPAEAVEERVLRDDSSGRVIERVIRRFDASGNPLPLEKTTVEETKRPGGLTIRTTTRRADLNGNMADAERSRTEVEIAGARRTSAVVIERPSINGSFEAVEKRNVLKEGPDEHYQENTVVFRKGLSGFAEAQREITRHSSGKGSTTEETALYEAGSSGQMELRKQIVSRATLRPDGSQEEEVDRFGTGIPGIAGGSSSGMRLQERESVRRRKTVGGLLETVSVQRPTVSDPGVLGPPKVISETECRGSCDSNIKGVR